MFWGSRPVRDSFQRRQNMWSGKAQVGSSPAADRRVGLVGGGPHRRRVWNMRQDPGNSMPEGEAEGQTGVRPWEVQGAQ